jgi:hypothetical protein
MVMDQQCQKLARKKQRGADTHSQRQMEICLVDRQPHYLRRHLERERERERQSVYMYVCVCIYVCMYACM